MGMIAKALGMAGTVNWRGKEYVLSPVGKQAIQAKFELWMAGQAMRRAKELAATLTTADGAQYLQDTRMDVGAGAYSFMSENTGKAMKTQEGQVQLVYLLINDNHPEFTPEMAKEMATEQLDEILEKLDAAGVDPNAQAPATA